MAYTGIPSPFDSDTPFNQMHFWTWACEQENRNDVTIKNYLAYLGFILGTDKLTQEEHERLDYAVDAWHRTSPWIREVLKFDDLFIPVPDPDGFYVVGKDSRFYPDTKIIDVLDNAGWVYEINPATTYFEIIQGNRLYAKYQQILGSRFIAIIKDI